MAAEPLEELKRLVRRLLDAWDAWLDSDTWDGPQYEELNAAVQGLRRYLEELEG